MALQARSLFSVRELIFRKNCVLPGAIGAVSVVSRSYSSRKREFRKLPDVWGRRIRKNVLGVPVVEHSGEENVAYGDSSVGDDTSVVEGDTFPDPPSSHENLSIFYDPLALKFINMLMRDGKKSQASKVFAKALGLIKKSQLEKATTSGGGEKIVLDPMVIFHQAVENAKPTVTTQTVRKGGKGYHVPCSLSAHRRTFMACRWIIQSVRQKDRGLGTAKKLAIDFLESYNHQGTAIKKKQDLHRLADSNRAYAHFRW